MVKLNKIYTRTGDAGDTGLVGGSRRVKHDIRVTAYGEVDEANAAIGIARCYVEDAGQVESLKRIQQDLFDLGADLSNPEEKEGALRIIDAQVERLEREIDAYNADLKPLESFVLPGGSKLAAQLHLARTVVRRAERAMCALAEKERVNPAAIRYVNRLSDFLFVLSRVANDGGRGDIVWEPGVNR